MNTQNYVFFNGCDVVPKLEFQDNWKAGLAYNLEVCISYACAHATCFRQTIIPHYNFILVDFNFFSLKITTVS